LVASFRVRPAPSGCGHEDAPIVFLPALATTGGMYRALDGKLTTCRARVFVDPPGIGDAPSTRTLDAGEVLRAIEDVIDANGGRAVLVGSSLGGVLAARFAAAKPDKVEALVLLDPAAAPFSLNRWEALVLHPGAWAPGYRLLGERDVIRIALPRLVGPRADAETVALIARDLDDSERRDTLMRYYRAFLEPDQLKQTRAALEMVQARALVMWGTRDKVVSPETMKVVVSALAHAETKVFDVGHMPALEVPDAVARAMEGFLGETGDRGPETGDRKLNTGALAPGKVIFGPRREWFPVLGLNAMFPVESLRGRADVAVLAGIARGGIDRHYPLESGRLVLLVGAATHSDPINATGWSFGYLRATARLEMVWRWAGGFHVDLTLLVDPLPERLFHWGGMGAIGYTPSVVPWLRGFVGWGLLPGGDTQWMAGVELDTRLTGLLY
jgi:pimeloyl-ACP methyl ester carboxylesterase